MDWLLPNPNRARDIFSSLVLTAGAALLCYVLANSMAFPLYCTVLLLAFAVVWSGQRCGIYGGVLSAVSLGVFAILALLEQPSLPESAALLLFVVALGTYAGVSRARAPERTLGLEVQRLKTVLNASPVGIILVSPAGRIVLSNSMVETMFGYPSGTLSGIAVEDLIPERFRKHHPGMLANFFKQPEARIMGAGRELPGRRRDGSEFPLEIGLTPLETPTGIHVVASVVDITTRHRYEKAIRDSEQRFRSLVESLPQLVWTCRPDGYCDYLSRQWVEYTGIPEAKQLGFGWVDTLHPDDRERVVVEWEQAVTTSDRFDTDFRIRNAEGEYRWFKTLAVRYQGTDGAIQWFGTNTDMQDFIQAQEEVQKLNVELEQRVAARTEALSAAKGHLHAILDGATEMSIIATDTNGLITLFNSGAERLLGYSAEEMVRKQTPAIMHDPEEVRQHGEALTREWGEPISGFDAFVAHARRGGYEEREWTYIRKDGSRLLVSLVVTAVRDEQDNITGFLGVAKDVTAARTAEAELRESEERFRQLVEGVRDSAVIMIDPEGYVSSWNAGAQRIKGYEEKEIVGKYLSVFYPPEERAEEHIEQRLEEALVSGRHEEIGWRVRKDGTRFWAHASISPIFHEDGSLRGFAELTRDVTERRAAEEALETNEALLRQFIKHSPAAIAMFDTDMLYLQASDRWLKDYQLENREIIGRSHYEVFPDVPERWKKIHARVLSGEVERCDEESFPRDDGSIEWLQWECQPWYQAGGIIGGLIMFTQVITDRKQTEERLREQEDRFRSAFDNAPIGMALVSPQGAWLRVNKSVCEMLGYTEAELQATTFAAITYPEDLESDLENVQRMLEGEIQTYQMEKRYIHRLGHMVYALLSVSLVRDSSKQPLYFISQIADITERKAFENHITASLQEKELLLKEIHHRVKNNLQVVCTLLDLQTEFTEDHRVSAVLQESQDRVRSMALIHERLYRTEDFNKVDFSDYVERLAEGLYSAYRTSADEVLLEVKVSGGTLTLDTAIPCGLLLNELISNCLKHAFPDGRGCINVSLVQKDGQGSLRVADTGRGLPENFDLSQTSSFGLQLIQTLVAQLRGTLQCDRDNGTVMTIQFPINE